MTEKDNFEERLLTELRQVASERPEPAKARSRWRPTTFALGGGGVAAVVAAVAIVAGGGSGASSAYAVETNPDGEVTVEIKSLKDADGLETSLRAAGIPAEVNYAPAMTIECVPPSEFPEGQKPDVHLKRLNSKSVPAIEAVPATKAAPSSETAPDGGAVRITKTVPATKAVPATKMSPVTEATTFTVDPREIGEGDKLYVTSPTRADAVGVAATIVASGEAPGC